MDDGCDRVHRENEEFERARVDYRKLRNGRESAGDTRLSCIRARWRFLRKGGEEEEFVFCLEGGIFFGG